MVSMSVSQSQQYNHLCFISELIIFRCLAGIVCDKVKFMR